jgi:CDP-diacylglycerol--glycerol-3-phosphate 3-phosphatidyltransferase/cardiolipin synthase
MNIPNSLTALRIVLIPVFVLVFYLPWKESHLAACLVFTVAALTDLLDGYLARRLNQISRLGEFLDPVADKLMIGVVLVLLVQRDPRALLALPAAVIIGREITVSALREWMAELGARSKVAVSVLGKIKTIAQMVALILMTFREPLLGLPVYKTGIALLYLAALLTLMSLCQYVISAWPKLRETAAKQ